MTCRRRRQAAVTKLLHQLLQQMRQGCITCAFIYIMHACMYQDPSSVREARMSAVHSMHVWVMMWVVRRIRGTGWWLRMSFSCLMKKPFECRCGTHACFSPLFTAQPARFGTSGRSRPRPGVLYCHDWLHGMRMHSVRLMERRRMMRRWSRMRMS